MTITDFEKPIAELESQIAELKRIADARGEDRSSDIAALRAQLDSLIAEVYANPSPWDNVQLARHPKRPYTLDIVRMAFSGFLELHGDRLGHNDHAIIGGFANLGKKKVMLIGHQKGRDLYERRYRNFASARPEGYRKALRLARLAEKFGLPLVSFVDTPAADASLEAEDRGISESIARNMMEFSVLQTPIVVCILGEGGSGGAIGIGVGDRILMLEHAIYSVIPPEGCANILWRDAARAPDAANALRLTAADAHHFSIVDEILPEPLGGAHRNWEQTAKTIAEALGRHLKELEKIPLDSLLDRRYRRFRSLGVYDELP
jgi:acetyl-CoA carboxylase carboxyl transferase subunit alpha